MKNFLNLENGEMFGSLGVISIAKWILQKVWVEKVPTSSCILCKSLNF